MGHVIWDVLRVRRAGIIQMIGIRLRALSAGQGTCQGRICEGDKIGRFCLVSAFIFTLIFTFRSPQVTFCFFFLFFLVPLCLPR